MLENPYIPHCPTPKQIEFLVSPEREVLFGGAAGGGKSDALLMAGLQFAPMPGYSGVILRRTYADLAKSDAIMARSFEWLTGTAARWNRETHTWHFPVGSQLSFGHLEHDDDRYDYQSAQFQFIGWDELTQFNEVPYRYLFSRLRRLSGMNVPLRVRSATNPGGRGHEWVLRRLILEQVAGERAFIPSTLDDNPHLDRTEYIKSLGELDAYTLDQLLSGNWFATPPGSKFQQDWFRIADAAPAQATRCRAWDFAATEPKKGTDPDWTVGLRMAESNGQFWIEDVVRFRGTPLENERRLAATAHLDGPEVTQVLEEEGGSSGKFATDHLRREVLKGLTVYAQRPTGSKEVRANPISSAAEGGNVFIVRGAWNGAFLDEVVAFPSDGVHDDQVDGMSAAHAWLASRTGSQMFRPEWFRRTGASDGDD